MAHLKHVFKWGRDFAQCYDITGLRMQALKDADLALRHSLRVWMW